MTDLFTGGFCFAESFFSSSYYPSKGCDDDDVTRWSSDTGHDVSWWIYDFGCTVNGSDILGSGTPSAESEYNATYAASKACDGNVGTRWSAANGHSVSWWKYDFGSGVTKLLQGIKITNHTVVMDIVIEGSTNDSDWDTLYTGTIYPSEINTYGFTWNTTSYRYIRISCTSITIPSILEIEVYDDVTDIKHAVNQINLKAFYSAQSAVGAFSIKGSIDGIDWDTLDSDTCPDDDDYHLYEFSNSTEYKFIKIDMDSDRNEASFYEIEAFAASGWTGKICGVTNPSKINGIAVADIAKVCGV